MEIIPSLVIIETFKSKPISTKINNEFAQVIVDLRCDLHLIKYSDLFLINNNSNQRSVNWYTVFNSRPPNYNCTCMYYSRLSILFPVVYSSIDFRTNLRFSEFHLMIYIFFFCYLAFGFTYFKFNVLQKPKKKYSRNIFL